MAENPIKVGDTLYFARELFPLKAFQLKPLLVKAVGRVYYSLTGGYQCYKDTMIVHGKGYSSPGKCYRSHFHFELERWKNITWNRICGKLEQGQPQNVLPGDLQVIARILQVDIDELPVIKPIPQPDESE